MFSDLLSHFSLVTIPLYHKTYHHFLGGGLFDSEIDIIAVPKSLPLSEKVTDILCSKEHTEVDSHHDIIVSCLAIPTVDIEDDTSKLLTAPRVPNLRKRIIWSEDAITKYQAILSSLLPKLRNDWYASSPSSFSVLLKVTNEVLDYVATETNKSVLLNAPPKLKRMAVPPDIRKAHIELKKAHNIFKSASVSDKSRTSTALTKAKQSYRLAVRRKNHSDNVKRDSLLFTICTTDSSTLLKKIRFAKRSAAGQVPYLTVEDKKYVGPRVADGMFDSISTLKTKDRFSKNPSSHLKSWSEDYQYILQLCKNKRDIPPISLQQSSKILLKMKPSVADYWSITPLHFRNAGTEGFTHFFYLMNMAISDTNKTTAKELNTVYALLLHKAHGKSRTSDRNYRTISTCPVLAKGLDMFLHDLFKDSWNASQAPTQYQGEGSSHELVSLLLTETIQESFHHHNLPVFLLFLDARSPFDTVVISFLIRNLYSTGMVGSSLNHINNRLTR